jgi:hypothetical protein
VELVGNSNRGCASVRREDAVRRRKPGRGRVGGDDWRGGSNPHKLNGRTYILNLLKLFEIDTSLTARQEPAKELGCPADLRADSANMNMWLRRTVLARIATNGGNVPKELPH